jgi:hypothetical protein
LVRLLPIKSLAVAAYFVGAVATVHALVGDASTLGEYAEVGVVAGLAAFVVGGM